MTPTQIYGDAWLSSILTPCQLEISVQGYTVATIQLGLSVPNGEESFGMTQTDMAGNFGARVTPGPETVRFLGRQVQEAVWMVDSCYFAGGPDVGREAGRASMMAVVLTRRVFRLPAELTGARSPELSSSLLERVLAEYHRQNPGPRFRIVESKYGLHFVAETAHDASARLGPARSVMDTIISVPEGTRTASAHFEAICEAISQAEGLRVTVSAIGIGDNWYEKLFAAPGGTLTWGATAVTARDALADLLDHSATSFSWRLFCNRTSLPYGDPRCDMNLQPIQVVRPNADGDPVLVRLEYDRRKK